MTERHRSPSTPASTARYTRREESFTKCRFLAWRPEANADVDGHLFDRDHYQCFSGELSKARAREAGVGGNFPVPAGTAVRSYRRLRLLRRSRGLCLVGVAVASYNVAILIDKGDGTPLVSNRDGSPANRCLFAGGIRPSTKGGRGPLFPLLEVGPGQQSKCWSGEGLPLRCVGDRWRSPGSRRTLSPRNCQLSKCKAVSVRRDQVQPSC